MGYESTEEYIKDRKELFEAIIELRKTFAALIDEQNYLANLNEFDLAYRTLNSYPALRQSSCTSVYNNCANQATANLALVTSGCVASVFIPFAGPFIGVGCEVAAIAQHYNATQSCAISYEDCTSNP